MHNVSDIRAKLVQKYKDQDFVTDKTGVKTIELIGESFIADEDWIIRKPNYEYIERELSWYESQSRYVEDIPGDTPAIWKQVADKNGMINSNYGYLIWSEENGKQYENVLNELEKNPNSRRAVMIYNRPSMHTDYCADGMSDFICTYANTFLIRDGRLVSHYLMRSNCAVHGFGNDVAWARHVHKSLANDLNVEVGDLIWTATSLHVYQHHFKFLEKMYRDSIGDTAYDINNDKSWEGSWDTYISSFTKKQESTT
jgi:thymidylate synthase